MRRSALLVGLVLVMVGAAVHGCATPPGSDNGDRDFARNDDFSIPGGFDFAGLDLTGFSFDMAGSGTCAGKDLMNDSANCGRCGRSCGADVCTMGRCPTVTMFSNENGPVGLAKDATSLYWSAGADASGYINKGLIGGGAPGSIDSGLANIQGIAASGNKVVWAVGGSTDNTGKLRGIIPGVMGGNPVDIVTGEKYPRGVYTDGTTVYWTAMGTGAGSYQDGALRKASVAMGSTASAVGNGVLKYAGIVFGQGANLFFTEQGSIGVGSTDGKVWKIAANAASTVAPSMLAMNQHSPFGIAADATNIWWLADDGVFKQAQSGGTAMNVDATAASRDHIVVDTTGVYWTVEGTSNGSGGFNADGKIMYAPLAGGTPVALAINQRGPIKIISDATTIYWTNYGSGGGMLDGSICKTPK
jgi:hypothetical protein